MLNLNLLSKNDLQNVKFEEWRRLVVFIFSASLTAIFFFVAILLPVYFFSLAEKKSVLDEMKRFESGASVSGVKSIEAEVASLNRFYKEIIQKGEPNRRLSLMIDRLISDSAGKISFFSVSYRKEKEVAMTGFAPIRQDLISFEKKMNEYEVLKEVSSPVSNLIKEANINFSLRAIPVF